MLLEAWLSCIAPIPEPDTGTLRGDLAVMFNAVNHGRPDDVMRRIFPQMIAASKVDAETLRRLPGVRRGAPPAVAGGARRAPASAASCRPTATSPWSTTCSSPRSSTAGWSATATSARPSSARIIDIVLAGVDAAALRSTATRARSGDADGVGRATVGAMIEHMLEELDGSLRDFLRDDGAVARRGRRHRLRHAGQGVELSAEPVDGQPVPLRHPPQHQPRRSPGAACASDDGGYRELHRAPMMRVRYLITVWTAEAADEHRVLGDVLRLLAVSSEVPAAYLRRRPRRAGQPGGAGLGGRRRDADRRPVGAARRRPAGEPRAGGHAAGAACRWSGVVPAPPTESGRPPWSTPPTGRAAGGVPADAGH